LRQIKRLVIDLGLIAGIESQARRAWLQRKGVLNMASPQEGYRSLSRER
jgi:hypothetical protein